MVLSPAPWTVSNQGRYWLVYCKRILPFSPQRADSSYNLPIMKIIANGGIWDPPYLRPKDFKGKVWEKGQIKKQNKRQDVRLQEKPCTPGYSSQCPWPIWVWQVSGELEGEGQGLEPGLNQSIYFRMRTPKRLLHTEGSALILQVILISDPLPRTNSLLGAVVALGILVFWH